VSRITLPLLPRGVRWLGVVAVVGIIVYYSLVTVPPEPTTGKPSLWDKRLHFAAYAVFAPSLAYATVDYRERPHFRGVAVFCVAVGFGLCIEILQGLVPYRYFGWGDMLANALGASLVSLWFPTERRIRYVDVRICNAVVNRS